MYNTTLKLFSQLTTLIFSDVKKVRKRKMRSFKLGLSKPKNKKNVTKIEHETELDIGVSESDEINESRETIDNISNSHFKRTVKTEPNTLLEDMNNCDYKESVLKEESIVDLVNKITMKQELKAAESYDLQNMYVPKAGTSTINNKTHVSKVNDSFNLSYESSPDDKNHGIMSFYNTSKIFDLSLDKSLEDGSVKNEVVDEIKNPKHEKYDATQIFSNFKDVNYVVLAPKIRPPSKKYIISTLEKYNIPKLRNPQVFYSDPNDVGDKVEIGQMILKLQSKSSRDQKAFDKVLDSTSIEEWRQLLFLQTNEMSEECSKPDDLRKLLSGNKQYILEPLRKPPTTNQLKESLDQLNTKKHLNQNAEEDHEISANIDELDSSQALGLNDEIDNSISPETDDKVNVTYIIK